MKHRYQIVLWTALGLISILPVLLIHDYHGSRINHFLMEFTGGFFALCTALFAFNCSLERREGFTVYVMLGFLAAGLTDILHALFIMGVPFYPEASIDRFVPSVWITGRTLLGVFILTGLLLASRKRGFRPAILALSILTIIIVPAIILFLATSSLPVIIMNKYSLVYWLWEYSVLILYAACVILIVRKSERRHTMLLLPFLALCIFAQLMMSFSREVFDPLFDGSHLLKVTSYLLAAAAFGATSWRRSRFSIEVASIRQLVFGAIMFMLLSCSTVMLLGIHREMESDLESKGKIYNYTSMLKRKINSLSTPVEHYLISGDRSAINRFNSLWMDMQRHLENHVLQTIEQGHSGRIERQIRAINTYAREAFSISGPAGAPRAVLLHEEMRKNTDALLKTIHDITDSTNREIRKLEKDEVRQTNYMIAGLTVAIIIFLPALFIIVVAMTGWQLKQILELTESAKHIRRSKRYKRATVVTEDETGTLAVVFNEMLDSIEESQIKRQKAHFKLELKVAERTEELNASRQMLQRVIDTIPVRVFWKNRNSKYLGCNSLFARDAGLDNSEQIIGLKDSDLPWADQAVLYQKGERYIMKSGEAQLNREETRPALDGSERYFLTDKVPLLNPQGNIIGVLGTYNDITERKKSEKEIRKLAEIIRRSDDFISLASTEGQVIYINDAGQKLLGLDIKKNKFPKTIFDYFFETDESFVRETILQTMFRRGLWKGEYRLRNFTTGKAIPIDISTFTITSPVSGGILAIATVCRDISEIKKYQEHLGKMVDERTEELRHTLKDAELSRDRIDVILKAVADGLIVTDKFNRVILMNRTSENLLGVRLSEVMNTPINFAIYDSELGENIMETLSNKSSGYQFDFKLQGGNEGQSRIMRACTSKIFDKNSSYAGIVTTIHDVTHERYVDRMKTEFISTAAHELRTPLTSIRGFSEILLMSKKISSERKQKYLTYINEQSIKLGEIISDLLDISRIESGGGFTLNKAFHNAGEIIKQVPICFEGISKIHTFDILLPREPSMIYMDQDKISQALRNIIGNTVKYSPRGGVVRVKGEVIGDEYQITVKDQGIGMTPEQVEKIFDKFYRADISNSAVEGTGLGMTIVKNIIESHGGDVWVKSKFGKGTTVGIRLPLAGDYIRN